MTPRFFLPKKTFSTSEQIFLTDEESHHAQHVLRIAENDTVYVLNGEGACAKTCVVGVAKRHISLSVEEVVSKERPAHHIYLVLALLRPGHLDFALEKCTELGVDHFIFYKADKSDRKDISPHNRQRYEHLTIAAMKQSGRFFLPSITISSSLEHTLKSIEHPCIYCDFEDNAPYLDSKLHSLPPSSIQIIVGPESGFSESEKKLLRQVGSPTLLHENILRAETAAICASYAASLWRTASLLKFD
jgi:16S rRNA (uracil1498-N3)-methyltransferase